MFHCQLFPSSQTRKFLVASFHNTRPKPHWFIINKADLVNSSNILEKTSSTPYHSKYTIMIGTSVLTVSTTYLPHTVTTIAFCWSRATGVPSKRGLGSLSYSDKTDFSLSINPLDSTTRAKYFPSPF